jgi:hypothetical protein
VGSAEFRRVQPRNDDEFLRILDSVIEERALVYGSPPPEWRDVDLLVRPHAAAAIAEQLRRKGFTAWGRAWIAFRGCWVGLVELIPAATLDLDRKELEALYAEGVPLDGLTRIVEPAPHHTLLLLARRCRRAAVLEPRQHTRIDRALASDPTAWRRAESRADLWHAAPALRRLQAMYGGAEFGGIRRLLPASAPARTKLIAVAGANRERVARHAAALRDALDRLGFRSHLDPFPHLAVRHAAWLTAAARSGSAHADRRLIDLAALGIQLWRPVRQHAGRGTVLICEGSVLACAAALSEGRASDPTVARQLRLLRAVAPKPLRTYLLDEPAGDEGPATAYRQLAAIFPVERLDARLSDDALCEQMAEDAWRRVSAQTKLGAGLRRVARAVRRRLRDA